MSFLACLGDFSSHLRRLGPSVGGLSSLLISNFPGHLLCISSTIYPVIYYISRLPYILSSIILLSYMLYCYLLSLYYILITIILVYILFYTYYFPSYLYMSLYSALLYYVFIYIVVYKTFVFLSVH